MAKLAVGLVLAIVLSLAAVSAALAQQSDVQITSLDCNSDPELVVLENSGDAAVNLAGWELRSDPTDAEVFDLSVLGGLQPGASVTIQSGPGATGVFRWSEDFIFRDDDPTDFVQLVDDTDTVVQQINCAEEPAPQPTPSPEATPSPGGVPDGGGPPPPAGISGAMVASVGGVMAAAGAALAALPWFRLRATSAAAGTEQPLATASRGRRGGSFLLFGAFALLLTGALVFFLFAKFASD